MQMAWIFASIPLFFILKIAYNVLMNKYLPVFLLLTASPLFSAPAYSIPENYQQPLMDTELTRKFRTATQGDFIAVKQFKHISLLRVHSKLPDRIIIEEISFPDKTLKYKKAIDWHTLLTNGAPKHTSWTLMEFTLFPQIEITETYSFDKNCWLRSNESNSLLYNLFTQSAQRVPTKDQQKIGEAPEEGPDVRKVWKPPIIRDGVKVKGAQFDVYRICWAQDASQLSGKTLDFYFDANLPNFPFPYFSRVTDDVLGSVQFSVIDSGSKLLTNRREMPRRPIQLIKPPQKTPKGWTCILSAPHYYKNFTLSALDVYNTSSEAVLLRPQILRKTGETVELCLPDALVSRTLDSKKTYTLTVYVEEPQATFLDLPGFYTPKN